MSSFRDEIAPRRNKDGSFVQSVDLSFMNNWSPRLNQFVSVYDQLCFTDECANLIKTAIKSGKTWVEFLEYPSIAKMLESITEASAVEVSEDGSQVLGMTSSSTRSGLPSPSLVHPPSSRSGLTGDADDANIAKAQGKRNKHGLTQLEQQEWDRYVEQFYRARVRLIPMPVSMNTLRNDLQATEISFSWWHLVLARRRHESP